MSILALVTGCCAMSAMEMTTQTDWAIAFEPETSTLTLTHTATGTRLSGVLRFEAVDPEKGTVAWKVVPPRDGIGTRLAIETPDHHINGYVTFAGTGDRLAITPVHRTRKNYDGHLVFDGEAALGDASFACRTQPSTRPQGVLQLASGPADSGLNDSIFDAESDRALCFEAENLSIKTAHDAFKVQWAARITSPGAATAVVDLKQHYCRDRYVPRYAPRNKGRCPKPPTGWMSWNTYFDTAGEEENLAEARIAAEHLKPFGMEIWHIESWQDNSPQLPVRDFSNLNLKPFAEQFPHGMKWLADEIRKLGFRPGIWTVPFGTGNREFYETHKDWFLHEPDGTPMSNWSGKYILDPSQEAVRAHMGETHRVMSQEWGYEYFKIDGMSGANRGYSAHCYEMPDVQAAFKDPACEAPFEQCVKALRRGIGDDRIWLTCQGHFTGPEIGYADAGRTGTDIVSWRKAPDWHNYSDQARITLNQIFVNNIVWWCDPDTLLVGEAAPETARLATTVVALPGQMMFAGDKLATLSPDQMRLLQQTLPVCDVYPMDLYPIFDMVPVWNLKIRRDFGSWDVVSLFNFAEESRQVSVSMADLGLPGGEYLAYDFWGGTVSACSDEISRDVPGHGNVLLALHPDLDRPQFLSTDRHITQGGVSLEALTWDDGAKTLSGRSAVVGGFPDTLTFHVPKEYALAEANADSAECGVGDDGPGLVRVTLSAPTSGSVAWTLKFE
ncbi:MAG: hypothetical protein GY851_07105 [bacterium]|nr:hypothetical protein [bacterium]